MIRKFSVPPESSMKKNSSDNSLNKHRRGSLPKVPQPPLPPDNFVAPHCEADMDSAYSETMSLQSMPNSDSRLSVTTAISRHSSSSSSSGGSRGVPNQHLNQIQAEEAARVKADKLRMAIQKIKDANIRKLFLRIFTADGCSKSLFLDESMTVRDVVDVLVTKNHCRPTPSWALVEQIPELHMERLLEDHERLVSVCLDWPNDKDNSNRILFVRRPDKYDLFANPHDYLMTNDVCSVRQLEAADRELLVTECFADNVIRVPQLEHCLWLKIEGKKSWKKHVCLLRPDGIYLVKGRCKSGHIELMPYASLANVEVYTAIDWKKRLKSPTEFGFALKPSHVHSKNLSKYVRYLCAESKKVAMHWLMAIRLAKVGHQLHENFESAKASVAACSRTNSFCNGCLSPQSGLAPPVGHRRVPSGDSGICEERKLRREEYFPEIPSAESLEALNQICRTTSSLSISSDVTLPPPPKSNPSSPVVSRPTHRRNASAGEILDTIDLPPPPTELLMNEPEIENPYASPKRSCQHPPVVPIRNRSTQLSFRHKMETNF
ncbi:unnamed protein product [Dimorphilus gyrociliatus]|uniref:Uncharacterized protein n=1 Tax=Dimorphilus gyrociliatus TaxID=2664684 RepID=A0A7I8VMH3_9ANNE|nr:unnamed protein product [Dimorphilus gyrociliatus]